MSPDEPSERPPGMPPIEDADGPPEWDQDEADWLVSKYALVGITYLNSDGETVESEAQYHGRIISADRNAGFAIECKGKWSGKTMGLPPMPGAFQVADRGEYRLRSTGEVVKDPDVLGTWSIIPPSKS